MIIGSGNIVTDSGYTNLEIYLNSLVADITEQQNADGEILGRVINAGEEILTEYEISGQTSNGDWTFAGGLKINQTGTPATGSNGTIKYSGNKKYTITLPANVPIDQVTIYGYCNSDNNQSHLAELAGKSYSPTDYVFPARNASESSITHSIKLDQPISDQMTFTTGSNNQSCFKIMLHIAATTGIKEVLHVKADVDNAFYNLQGTRVTNPTKGIYIRNGKKIIIK